MNQGEEFIIDTVHRFSYNFKNIAVHWNLVAKVNEKANYISDINILIGNYIF